MSIAPIVEQHGAQARIVQLDPVQTHVPGGRILALDGLRGVAVLLVVVMHYLVVPPGPENSEVHAFFARLFSLSFCGVDLFFVLSGYFIGGILLDYRDSNRLLPAFYFRRFVRIVPLYAVLLASFFLCREIAGLTTVNRGTYFWSTIPDWSYFAFVQNIAMCSLRDIGPYWLGVTWSLAVEEQFYLLLPWVVLRLKSAQLVRACLVFIALAPALRIAALYYAQNSTAAVFLLPMRADGLLWGVVCAVWVRDAGALAIVRGQQALLTTGLAAASLLLVVFSLGRFGADSVEVAMFGYSVLSLYFASLLLYVVAFPTSSLARLLSNRPLAKIGLTSYFIYLFHTPIWYLLHWGFFRLPPLHVRWDAGAVTLLAVLTTLGLALLSWHWFEGPLLKLAKRVSYR